MRQSQVGNGFTPLYLLVTISAVLKRLIFVEDVLRDNEFSVVYGESNCGKTFFMLDLAMRTLPLVKNGAE